MTRRICLIVGLAIMFFAAQATSKEAVPTDTDRVQQKRAVELSEKLRCLVCQNQTIADSNAELAQDLRRQVREMIAQGRTDGEITAYMVQRYGDFVLYEPPIRSTTVLLWFGPLILLLIGIAVLVRNLRSRRLPQATATISTVDRERAKAILGERPGEGGT